MLGWFAAGCGVWAVGARVVERFGGCVMAVRWGRGGGVRGSRADAVVAGLGVVERVGLAARRAVWAWGWLVPVAGAVLWWAGGGVVEVEGLEVLCGVFLEAVEGR